MITAIKEEDIYCPKDEIQGMRLAEIRKTLLELSQKDFTLWLAQRGIVGNYGEPYKAATVAAWEHGRLQVPQKVKEAVAKETGVQYSYLNGDTNFPTKSIHNELGIKNIIAIPETPAFSDDEDIKHYIDNLCNKALFGKIFFDDIMPLLGINQDDIFDTSRAKDYFFNKFKNDVTDYIEKEKNGL